jgi:surface protein
MKGLFQDATSFNQDISNWDVSSLSEMKNMFYGATSFNAPIGKWKVKSITDMENMFREATAFNQDISSWDVSNVTQMKGLFQDATSFNQNIRNWKLNEKLPKSRTMFEGAKAFNIKEYNPFLNIKAKKREVDTSTANLSPNDKRTFLKIKKLLVSRDYDKIDLGLELLISLNNLELFESLLDGCKISTSLTESASRGWSAPDEAGGKEYYQLIKNKFFTGSDPAQPYLDYALEKIIINAPQDAKIDDSLLLKNIFSLDTGKFSFIKTELHDFLRKSIDKLNPLTSVDISSPILHHLPHLTELNVSGDLGNLKWLKNISQLKILYFDAKVDNIDAYENFKYLENLEELTFSSSKFEHLDFLAECKKIKKLDLSVSYSGSSYSNDKKLENIDFLSKLNNLEDLKLIGLDGALSDMDKSGLYNCKKLKHLSIPISGATNLSDLKKCKSLESLNFTLEDSPFSRIVSKYGGFDVSARIYQLNGLKKLNKLKKLRLESFTFFGIENGNLMSDAKPEKSNLALKVSASDIQVVDEVIRYKALPFTGTVINQASSIEYEVVDGLKNGLYREFYETGKVKLEGLYKKNKLSKITGFYNGKGENILGNKGAVLGFDLSSLDVHRIDGNSGGFVKNDKPYNGFCYIELEPGSYYRKSGWEKNHLFSILKSIIDNSSFDFEDRMDSNKFNLLIPGSKISLVLKIKQGIISNTIFLARSEHFAKITVADNYNFDRMPSYVSDEDKLEFMKIENAKQHRLNIYFHPMSEWNICVDGEKAIEIDDEVSPILKAHIDSVKNSLVEGGKTEVRSLPLWDYIIKIIDTSASQTLSGQRDTKSQKNLERPKLSSEDRKAFSEIKKQLTSRDYDKIDQAISKLISLNLDELFETLLEGCDLSASYDGRRNKFFTGSQPAQPYLDYALFCLIANAPEGADIHESIKNEKINKLDVTIFNLSASYKSPTGGLTDRFIPIDNLTSLNDLTIDFKIFEGYNKGPKNIDRSDWFKKSNITKLNAEVSGSLKFFKNLGQLKYLNLSFTYSAEESITDLKSLESLENLAELKINTRGFETLTSIDFIKNSKKLKKLDFHIESSWNKKACIENLDVIKNFNQLEELDISGLKSTDLKALLSCKKLKKLSLSFDRYDKTGFDFNILKNCNSLESLSISGIESYNLEIKIIDFNSLNGLKNLKSIKIGGVNLNNSKSVFIN